MNALSIQRRATKAITGIKGMGYRVYTRQYVKSANTDALTGRDTGVTTDTVVNPQPVYSTVSDKDVLLLSGAGKNVTTNDYLFTFTNNSITEDILENPTTQFVLKDTTGVEQDLLKIVDYTNKGLQGITLLWSVVARSIPSE